MALTGQASHYCIVFGYINSANRIPIGNFGFGTVFCDNRFIFCLEQAFNQSITAVDDQDPDKRSHVTPFDLKLHYDFIGAQIFKQFEYRAPQHRVDQLRGDLTQRLKHEAPLGQPGMGQNQFRAV